jgi:uncharacterized protein (UPF0332 family)
MGSLAFNWSDYLTLANQLSSNPDQASQRSAISRAYYCIYHKALERAVANGHMDQKSHIGNWDVYSRNSADRDCRKLYDIGTRMKKERADADYDPNAPRIADRMNVQLNRANRFLARLAALPAGLPRP